MSCCIHMNASLIFTLALQVFMKVITGHRPELPAGMPGGYSRLMQACWHEDPSDRPAFQDIVADLSTMYLSARNSGLTSQQPCSSLSADPWS